MFYDSSITISDHDVAVMMAQFPALARQDVVHAIVRYGPKRSRVQAALEAETRARGTRRPVPAASDAPSVPVPRWG